MEKLQKQIQAVAKKTGISSATKLAQVAKQKAQEMQHVPDIEWWDLAILPHQTYNDFERELKAGEERFINITRLVEHPIVKDAPCMFNIFSLCYIISSAFFQVKMFSTISS